jgi:hypothetical protein
MTPVERAKAMLSKMPSQLFDTYMVPFIEDCGWPFNNLFDLTHNTPWFQLFHGLPPYKFSNLQWSLTPIVLNENLLHPNSFTDIKLLIADHVLDMETPIRRKVVDSKKRFLWHMEYIKRTGKFCTPIVIMKTESNNFIVLDGVHRTSALYALQLQHSVAVNAWIGA